MDPLRIKGQKCTGIFCNPTRGGDYALRPCVAVLRKWNHFMELSAAKFEALPVPYRQEYLSPQENPGLHSSQGDSQYRIDIRLGQRRQQY